MNLHRIIQLKPEEEMLETARAHAAAVLPKLVLVGVWFVAPFLFVFPLWQQGTAGMIFFLALTISAAMFGFRIFYKWHNSMMVMTDRRIFDIEQKGLFDRVVSEVPLERVDDVNYEIKGVWATIFGYGSLHVYVQGAGADLMWKRLRRPSRLQNIINDARHVHAPLAA